jgi:hypothetical protein
MVCPVATGIHATVNRQNNTGHPRCLDQIEYRIGNILRRAGTPEWLHAVQGVELRVVQGTMQAEDARRADLALAGYRGISTAEV